MKYWLMAIGWALICFSGGPFTLDIIRGRETNIPFLIGGFIGITLMVLSLVIKNNPKQVNPFFK
ncbi:hypothetical protein [Alkalihalobacterium bogoriense]|uniref:hypothetical protein n=1 Tax=Alkalihalobacterium bogoriense TaxID=246272 RepID=UPI00047E3D3D|nr:hypothetical protein [Alkalihalobacterium bogoriense]